MVLSLLLVKVLFVMIYVGIFLLVVGLDIVVDSMFKVLGFKNVIKEFSGYCLLL